MKDIKLKDTKQYISTLNQKEVFDHYAKKKNVKKKSDQKKQEPVDASEPTKKATNTVVRREKQTAVDSVYMAKQYAKKMHNKKSKTKEEREVNTESIKQDAVINIKEKHLDIKDKKSEDCHHIRIKDKDSSSDFVEHSKVGYAKSKNLKSTERKTVRIKSKETVTEPKRVAFRSVNKNDYQKQMKFFNIKKHKMKVKEAQETTGHIKKGFHHIGTGIKNTFKVAKIAVTSVQNIISIGGALILLIVISLFFGVFSALSDDSNINSAIQPVSAEVLAYSDTVAKYAKEYGLQDYIGVINAVMMQESGGKGNDPMQSSECEFNEKYPKKPGAITNPTYSIQVGIRYLAENIKLAEVKDPTDIKHLSLALQAYNYGKGYIQWANINFGGYTRANAKVFSDQKKAELKTNVYGDPLYVVHVMQYYHIGNNNIVQIAQSQIGNIGGRPYWSWYGFNGRVEWCACFVSWVMNEAGLIEKGTVPKFAYCPTGIQWFKEHQQWKSKGSIPQPGDIIFFDWEQDGISDHVGIVEKVENNIVYTIEGNSINDECRQRNYGVNSQYICGYGAIKAE